MKWKISWVDKGNCDIADIEVHGEPFPIMALRAAETQVSELAPLLWAEICRDVWSVKVERIS